MSRATTECLFDIAQPGHTLKLSTPAGKNKKREAMREAMWCRRRQPGVFASAHGFLSVRAGGRPDTPS